MQRRIWRIILVPAVVLLLGAAFLALLPGAGVLAQGGTGIVRVATIGVDGTGCGSLGSPCRTIQYAVNEAAEGDEVRIAAGTYTGTRQVWALGAGEMTTMTQVVIVTKSLTLRGGYTAGDWSASDPAQNVTTVDAQGYGRGITIVGDGAQTVTVEGLTITGGDYTGLGNGYADGQCNTNVGDCGGGLYAYRVLLTIRQAVISGNVASLSSSSSHGGGIHLRNMLSGSQVHETDFINNLAGGSNAMGGGMSIRESEDFTISRSRFVRNWAQDMGGGLDFQVGSSMLMRVEASEFISNGVSPNANGLGGGLYVRGGVSLIRSNTFISNTGRQGGGLAAQAGGGRHATVEQNLFFRNWTGTHGGAILIGNSCVVTVTNNILAENSSTLADGVMVHQGARGLFYHNTIAGEPSRTGGEAVYVKTDHSTAELWNNIIVSHTYGIKTNGTVTVSADHTLFYGNDQDLYVVDGIIASTNEITGQAPLFVDPAGFDYHISAGSPAVDAAPDVGVTIDIDSEPRPNGGGYDVGADEVMIAPLSRIHLPLTLR